VSSLWTPDGEHRVTPAYPDPDPAEARRPAGTEADPSAYRDATDERDVEDLSPEEEAELAGRLDELRRQLLGTPAEVVVANHAYGLFELAAIHLSQRPLQKDQARLAVDAMASLVEGLAGRLGSAEDSLKEALAQIRLAFVQIGTSHPPGEGAGDGPGG
jgi:hypothetical protein